MKIKYYFFLPLLFILASIMHAQDVRVTVKSPSVVRVGEPFQLIVQVNADATNAKLPEIEGFRTVAFRGRSESTQVSIVNGRVSQSKDISFNYVVQADVEGTMTIEPVEATVGGKTYRAAAVSVQVVAGNAQPQQTQPQQQQSGSGAQQGNPQVQADNRDVFAEVITDRRQVYTGEYINATVKFYSRFQLSNLGNVELPTFDGFFKQEVETQSRITLEQETINGVQYLTGVVRKYVLFPQKSGTLTINPCKVELHTVQRVQGRSRSIFDEFFGGSTQTLLREAISRPVNITVLPLPNGKPASFTGGVGQLNFEATIDNTEVNANDVIVLKVTVSGNGNVKFVDAPRINFPPDFEVYDPKIANKLNAANTAGSKTFEYLIIPRHGGAYKIPAIEFSYFDPKAKEYKTLHSEEFTINVERGDEQPGTPMLSGITRESIKRLGEDINYIKTGKMNLRRKGDNFFGTLFFWLWYIVPLVVFTVIVFLRRNYIRKYSDVAMVKNRKANRYAAKRLKKSRKYMDSGQKEQFYEELSRALWGYLGDKLNIPVAELSKDNAKAVMGQRQVDDAISVEFTGVIEDCEFARYAPSAAGSDMNALYERAAEVIKSLNQDSHNYMNMKKILLIFFIVLKSLFPVFASDADSVLIRAEQYYKQSEFSKAIAEYQSLTEAGWASAELFYNLGNAYFRNNDIKSAILYYERAKRLAPNDEAIVKNLELMRSLSFDKIEDIPELFIITWGKAIRDLMTVYAWAWWSIGSFIAMLVLALLFLFVRNMSVRRFAFGVGVFCFLLCVATFSLGYLQKANIERNDEAIVFAPSVTIKSSPDESGNNKFIIHEGTSVRIEYQIDNWCFVRIADGEKGWIRISDLKII